MNLSFYTQNFFSPAISSNIHRHFNNTFHESKVRKVIFTEKFNVDFHNKFIRFGLISFFYFFFLYIYIYTYTPAKKKNIYIYTQEGHSIKKVKFTERVLFTVSHFLRKSIVMGHFISEDFLY